MIRIIHAYPDLLNLYGDYANIMLIEKCLSSVGEEVITERLEIGQDADFKDADFIYFGCATENKMLAAAKDLLRLKNQIAEYLENGGKMFFCGASCAVPLDTITDLQGDVTDGLGLIKGNAVIHGKRNYSEVTAKCDLCDETVVGFFNSSIKISAKAEPLWKIESDSAKLVGETEGYISGGVTATQLSGPLFFRNPPLLYAVCEMLAGQKIPAPTDNLFNELNLAYKHISEEMQGK